MDSTKDDQGFITRLEQLKFNSTSVMCPSATGDVFRSLYLHLSEGNERRSKRSMLNSESSIYLKKYADVVDCMDDSGLNNFAEGALALCSHHKNESAKWQSSLSVESILQLPAFADCGDEEEEDELDEDPIIPLGRETTQQNATSFTAGHEYEMERANGGPLNRNGLSHGSQWERESTQGERWPSHPLTAVNFKDSTTTSMRETPRFRHSPFSAPMGDMSGVSHVVSEGQGQSVTQRTRTQGHGNCFSFHKAKPHEMNSTTESFHHQSAKKSQEEASTYVEINSNKYGGPFANFGQKRKAQEGSKDCQRGPKGWQTRVDNEERAEGGEDNAGRPTPFKTAKQQFIINQQKKFGNSVDRSQVSSCNYGTMKRSLGTRRGPASKFVPPVISRDSDENESPCATRRQNAGGDDPDEPVDERLKGIDPKMIELINNEIMDHGANITWADVAGLEFAKKTIKEIVVWPMLRPKEVKAGIETLKHFAQKHINGGTLFDVIQQAKDKAYEVFHGTHPDNQRLKSVSCRDIFTGLRGPPKGLLLFGPPGTGKTLIGKCIASQSKSTFFCISASSLTSKWVGEGEKMVRALFAVARCNQPAVVFIDEIDSLLSQRSDGEHESSRRIKTEFLVQLDGAATASDDRILVIGATNRPQEIDEAARRRFVKRLLIPLPEAVARKQIVVNLMSQQKSHLSEEDVDTICERTDGYSGADMSNLCREAALGPIRSIPLEQMETITPEQVRPILYRDFEDAMRQVRASVSPKDLELYTEWNKTYGSFGCS